MSDKKMVYVTYFQFFDAKPADVQILAQQLKKFSDKLKKEHNLHIEFIVGNQYIEPKSIDWLVKELDKIAKTTQYTDADPKLNPNE